MKVWLAVLLFVFLIPVSPLFADNGEYLRYEELIKKVETGAVKSVNLGPYSLITGIYVVNGAEKQFRSYHTRNSTDDPLFIRLLKEKKVVVNIEEKKEKFFPWGIGLMSTIMFLIPVITFIYIIRINHKVNKVATSIETIKQYGKNAFHSS